MYIEPFFGAGGMFFNKPKAKYNILNDIDSEVFNLFQVILNNKNELIDMFLKMPVHEDLWNYWKKHKEIDPIKRAIRFLFLSNYGFFGMPRTMLFPNKNTSEIILKKIDETAKFMFGVDFMNCDFREMFKKIRFSNKNEKEYAFIYADPPYLHTENNYKNSFTEKDSLDLFDTLQNTGIKWAMSEFDNPFILNQAKERNLNVIIIGEKKNIRNRRVEILITNYKTNQGFLMNF
jgi:DNA adenine methylase